MNVVHFGAGNIGKGLIGYVLSLNQANLCFVDVDANTVNQLNRDKRYTIKVLEDKPEDITINSVSATLCQPNSASLFDAVIHADLITTSVGVNNLAKIAGILVQAIQARAEAGKPAIEIIANENAINASSILEAEIRQQLAPAEFARLKTQCYFVNSAIDRQSLSIEEQGHLMTAVEPFYEWVVEKRHIVNPAILKLKGITFVEDLLPYIEKKLYIVNLGHCATAYLGYVAQKPTILDTLNIPAFHAFVVKVMQQSAQYLVKQYQFNPTELSDYIENTLRRFSNPHLQDTVTRVGRSPIRKLGPNERITGPMQALYQHQLPYHHLVTVMALALHFRDPSDEQAEQLQQDIQQSGLQETLKRITQIQSPALIEQIENRYIQLSAAIQAVRSAPELENRLGDFLTQD